MPGPRRRRRRRGRRSRACRPGDRPRRSRPWPGACLMTLVSASATMKYAVVSMCTGSRGASTRTSTGRGRSSTSDSSPARSPPRVSAAGRMPRTTSRSSLFARSALVSASSMSSTAPCPAAIAFRASLRVMTVWTSRCCALSWTSRWRRRRVSSAVATTRAREAVSFALFSALAIAGAGELGELGQAVLGPRRDRGSGGAGGEGAPHPSFQDDGDGHPCGHAELASQVAERRAREGVHAGRPARAEHIARPRAGVHRDPQPERGGAVAHGDGDRGVVVVAQERGGRVTEQLRRFGGHRGEHLVERRAAGDELGDAAQRGLLVGEPTQLGPRLCVGERGGHELGEARDARFGIGREGLRAEGGGEADAPDTPVDDDRDIHRGRDAERRASSTNGPLAGSTVALNRVGAAGVAHRAQLGVQRASLADRGGERRLAPHREQGHRVVGIESGTAT